MHIADEGFWRGRLWFGLLAIFSGDRQDVIQITRNWEYTMISFDIRVERSLRNSQKDVADIEIDKF